MSDFSFLFRLYWLVILQEMCKTNCLKFWKVRGSVKSGYLIRREQSDYCRKFNKRICSCEFFAFFNFRENIFSHIKQFYCNSKEPWIFVNTFDDFTGAVMFITKTNVHFVKFSLLWFLAFRRHPCFLVVMLKWNKQDCLRL